MMNRTIAPIALAAMAAYFDGLGSRCGDTGARDF